MLLGVTGGIAAYKTVQLARDLTRLGAEVDVILTRSASAFVGSLSFEGVTGRPVGSDLLAPGAALDHIRLARDADVVCVAPATADFLARAAVGRSNDLLAAILLATRAPVLICPAMNDLMWSHPATQTNAERLRVDLGYRLCGPAVGPLAFDEGEGPGRMEDPAVIREEIGRLLEVEGPFSGKRVLVTAGPTREPVDPVRFLSNRSSGRMGVAMAAAAWRRGAEVVLVHGQLSVPLPARVRAVEVHTAEEMLDAVRRELAGADALIMAAAVADFRPAQTSERKVKKSEGPGALELTAAPDILAETIGDRPERLATLGFALETEAGAVAARGKLEQKSLDQIALNMVGEDSGFESATNRVTLIDGDGGEEALPLLPKEEVAEAILDRFGRFLA